MKNTLINLRVIIATIVVSIVISVAAAWLINHASHSLESNASLIADFRNTLTSYYQHQSRSMVSGDLEPPAKLKAGALEILTRIKARNQLEQNAIPNLLVDNLLESFNDFLIVDKQVHDLRKLTEIELPDKLQTLKTELSQLANNPGAAPIKNHLLGLYSLEQNFYNKTVSAEAALNKISRLIKELFAFQQPNKNSGQAKFYQTLAEYQATINVLASAQQKLTYPTDPGLLVELTHSQQQLLRSINDIERSISSELSEISSALWNTIILSISWLGILLGYAFYQIHCQLVVPLQQLDKTINEVMTSNNFSLLPKHNYRPDSAPIIKDFNCLLEGYDRRIQQFKLRFNKISENMDSMFRDTQDLHLTYANQSREYNKASKTLTKLTRNIYENTVNSKKAYVEAAKMSKTLNRPGFDELSAQQQITRISEQVKQLKTSFARYELLSLQVLNRFSSHSGNKQQRAIDRIVKSDLLKIAGIHQKAIDNISINLIETGETVSRALYQTDELAQSSSKNKKLTNQLIESTNSQAEKFNGFLAVLTQLGCDASSGSEYLKNIVRTTRNSMKHFQYIASVLNEFHSRNHEGLDKNWNRGSGIYQDNNIHYLPEADSRQYTHNHNATGKDAAKPRKHGLHLIVN